MRFFFLLAQTLKRRDFKSTSASEGVVSREKLYGEAEDRNPPDPLHADSQEMGFNAERFAEVMKLSQWLKKWRFAQRLLVSLNFSEENEFT